MSSPDVVVVSPHLDDGVLSAAAQLVRPGARLVTVFAGVPGANTAPGWWDCLTGAGDAAVRVRERWAEDDAAVATLGTTTRRLSFPDSQHRPPGNARVDHDVLVAALTPELAGATEVWAPAGIGCHADHLATRDAALAAAPDGVPLHHYADVPYSVPYGWPAAVTSAEPAAHLDVEWWLLQQLDDCGLLTDGLRRITHRLEEPILQRKVAAMACYATQLPALQLGRAVAESDPLVLGFELSWSPA